MLRTQIYLTPEERDGLSSMARATGRNQSELIRIAIDRLIEQSGAQRRKNVLDQAAGIWAGRTELPDLSRLRSQWDRG